MSTRAQRDEAPWPHFGQLLRAARLCFGWSGRHRAFIRMTEVSAGRFRVEAVAHGCLPKQPNKGEMHALWYEKHVGHEPASILDCCAPLRALAAGGGLRDGRSATWYVGDDGNELTWSTGIEQPPQGDTEGGGGGR